MFVILKSRSLRSFLMAHSIRAAARHNNLPNSKPTAIKPPTCTMNLLRSIDLAFPPPNPSFPEQSNRSAECDRDPTTSSLLLFILSRIEPFHNPTRLRAVARDNANKCKRVTPSPHVFTRGGGALQTRRCATTIIYWLLYSFQFIHNA